MSKAVQDGIDDAHRLVHGDAGWLLRNESFYDGERLLYLIAPADGH
jgi:hypothetical protein